MPLGKSPLLQNDLMAEGDNQKYLLFNDALVNLEDSVNRSTSVDLSTADVALTETQVTRFGRVVGTGHTVAREIVIPISVGSPVVTTNRVMVFQNDGTDTLNITHNNAGTSVLLGAGAGALVYADGTDVYQLGGADGASTIKSKYESNADTNAFTDALLAAVNTIVKHNRAASTDPAAGNDTTEDYAVGSTWVNTTADTAWICLDASTGAAVWTEITGAGGSGIQDNLVATTDPAVSNDNTEGYAVGSTWVNVTADSAWICVDASTGAAVWTEFTATGGGSGLQDNLVATTNPAVSNDTTEGYAVGSMWVNVTADTAWICLDASTGAAVWTEVTAAGGGSGLQDNLVATADPVVSNDTTEGYAVGSMWVNVTADTAWICVDSSTGAAVWTEVTAAGGGGGGELLLAVPANTKITADTDIPPAVADFPTQRIWNAATGTITQASSADPLVLTNTTVALGETKRIGWFTAVTIADISEMFVRMRCDSTVNFSSSGLTFRRADDSFIVVAVGSNGAASTSVRVLEFNSDGTYNTGAIDDENIAQDNAYIRLIEDGAGNFDVQYSLDGFVWNAVASFSTTGFVEMGYTVVHDDVLEVLHHYDDAYISPNVSVNIAGYTGPSPLVQSDITVAHTVTNADLAGNVYRRIELAGANNITVPTGLTGTEPVTFIQAGAGQCTFAPAVGVTINSADGNLKTRVQYSSATLVPVASGTDEYDLVGDLTT